MDRPIGVMDSGVGGMTVVREITRQLPNERILYFGDISRCPYGEKDLDTVRTYTIQVAEYLVEKDIKMLVIACNTATAAALDILRERLEIPVIGVIGPGARSAIQHSRNGKVLVLATSGTVKSDAYPAAIKKLNQNFEVTSQACPAFVPLVEELRYKDDIVTGIVIHQALKAHLNSDADTVILGCTHYPLLKENIRRYFEGRKAVIDSGYETAREVSSILNYQNILRTPAGEVTHTILINGDSSRFKYILRDWLPELKYDMKEIELKV